MPCIGRQFQHLTICCSRGLLRDKSPADSNRGVCHIFGLLSRTWRVDFVHGNSFFSCATCPSTFGRQPSRMWLQNFPVALHELSHMDCQQRVHRLPGVLKALIAWETDKRIRGALTHPILCQCIAVHWLLMALSTATLAQRLSLWSQGVPVQLT